MAVGLTIFVLIGYVGLGPAGEYAPGGPDWSGFIAQGLLIAGLGLGSAVLMPGQQVAPRSLLTA